MAQYDAASAKLHVCISLCAIRAGIDAMQSAGDDVSSKECVNMLSLLCLLYNFKARYAQYILLLRCCLSL